MKRISTLLFILPLFSFPAMSQFRIEGEWRPRAEYRRGYKNIISTTQEDAFFVSQRTRISLDYALPKICFKVSFQDVRVWGDEELYSSSGIFGSSSTVDLNEAWVNITLYPKGKLKIGRQFWSYEDERILSQRNWNQSQVKYNGITFLHQGSSFRVDLGLSWNSSAENVYGNEYPSDKIKTMNFVYLTGNIFPWLKLSGIIAISGFTESDTTSKLNMLATYTGYANLKTGDFEAVLSGSVQHGESRKGVQSLAYMFSAKAKYRLHDVALGIGIDYLSGNNESKGGASYAEKEHSYDILYGARHRYYGHLDLFTSLQSATYSGGLMDIFINTSWKFVPKAAINADFHYFSLQNSIRDFTLPDTEDKYFKGALGPEADLNISWDILEFLNLKAGYSIMLPSETMDTLQGISESSVKKPQWIWAMITATPELFTTSK